MTASPEGVDPYPTVLADLEARRHVIARTIQLLETVRGSMSHQPELYRTRTDAGHEQALAEARSAALEEAAQLVEERVSESDWFAELANEGAKIAAAIRELKP